MDKDGHCPTRWSLKVLIYVDKLRQLVKFSLALNYTDQVEFVGDSEPTMKSLMSSVKLMRQQLGLATTVTHAKPNEKGRTAQVERAIQTVRRQASTLVNMAEVRCELRLPSDHPVHLWSYLYSTWTLNRFHCPAATQISPFELVNGRRYAGKVACFGEAVMVLHRRGLNVKQGPQWVPGIWLGKTEQEDLHVVATCDGIIKGKANQTHIDRNGDRIWLFLGQAQTLPEHTQRGFQKALKFGGTVTPRACDSCLNLKAKMKKTIDYDARDVRDYARADTPTTPMMRVMDFWRSKNKIGSVKLMDETFSPRKAGKFQDGGSLKTVVVMRQVQPVVWLILWFWMTRQFKNRQSKAPRLSSGAQRSSPSRQRTFPTKFCRQCFAS